MTKVSVIMSVYNVDNYDVLLASVKSILNQSFKDFEFIICNDGSSNAQTEEYLKIIKNFDSRIKIIGYKKNMGLAYSRNQCIKFCKGKYIAFQDDDDVSAPDRLNEEVNFLDTKREYSFVGTNANVFDKNGIWGEYINPQKPAKKDFLWNSPFLNPSMMFRAQVLKENKGFRVAKKVKRVEDYDLFFRLYAKGYKGYNIQKKLFNYRIEIEKEKNKKYRPMHDRINEARIRMEGYKGLGMPIIGIPFIIKPILIGLIPHKIFYFIRKRQY
ncbi:glycosyltransferase [uncultured Lactobacillus sp.]|uniref:glycosyltransferase n=1 Tax=uncultured Lactobacillus sp. TaxID=153152 RepID=UPI00261FDCB5|nr:glycosyltransferase [uncultured Lactobacillus sp.]